MLGVLRQAARQERVFNPKVMLAQNIEQLLESDIMASADLIVTTLYQVCD